MTLDDVWQGWQTKCDTLWAAAVCCAILGAVLPRRCEPSNFMGTWVVHGWPWTRTHENHMTVQDAQDVQDIARCQRVSSAFFSFFLWICWTIWTWSPHQEMRFANSGLEWIDHTRRLLAIENVCLDRSSLAKLMTSHQTSKIGRPRQSQKSIEKLAMQQEGTIVE